MAAGFEDLLERVRRGGGGGGREEQREAVPWLQILLEMLGRFSSWFSGRRELYLRTFKCVVATLQGCKLARVKGLLFGCCERLLSIEEALSSGAAAVQTSPDWMQVRHHAEYNIDLALLAFFPVLDD